MSGRVAGMQRSGGGVPKLPIQRARVDTGGVEGDWQEDRRYHGGPDRALCLFSLELIEALRAEGHPITPGSTGENLTIAGIDWRAMQPGARFRIGTVDIEITAFAAPCRTIRHSFVKQRYTRISEKVNPGWSRVYARVLTAGDIAVGDVVQGEAAT